MSYPVTVITPAWNEPRAEIVATVENALAAGAAECIVMDDGSAEPVAAIGGARVIRQMHAGIAAAMNRGFREATQPWCAMLSVRDRMIPKKLRLQLDAMESAGAEASFHDWLDSAHRMNDRRAPADWQRHMWTDNAICWSTAMLRTDLARRVPWDESLIYCADRMVSMQIEAAVGWLYIAECLGSAGEHSGGHTSHADPVRRALDGAIVSRWARDHEREHMRWVR